MSNGYSADAPSRDQVDALEGPAVVEFGTNWCGHCRAAQPAIQEAMSGHPEIRHLKVEDGKGRPLGRSYQVKLWPTLIFLKDGEEMARVVRPQGATEIEQGLASID